jgi:hypothetical protein
MMLNNIDDEFYEWRAGFLHDQAAREPRYDYERPRNDAWITSEGTIGCEVGMLYTGDDRYYPGVCLGMYSLDATMENLPRNASYMIAKIDERDLLPPHTTTRV